MPLPSRRCPLQDAKVAIKDDVLPDGTKIKAGAKVVYMPYVMGRMERCVPSTSVCLLCADSPTDAAASACCLSALSPPTLPRAPNAACGQRRTRSCPSAGWAQTLSSQATSSTLPLTPVSAGIARHRSSHIAPRPRLSHHFSCALRCRPPPLPRHEHGLPGGAVRRLHAAAKL